MEKRERAGRPGGSYLGDNLEEAEDLTALCGPELRGRLEELVREEREVSQRRRVLRSRIDVIRSELARRGSVGASPEELARVLASGLAWHAERAEDLP